MDHIQFELPYQFWPPNPFATISNWTKTENKGDKSDFDDNFSAESLITIFFETYP